MSLFQIQSENLVEQSEENVESAGGEVVQANADGAYDANDNFKVLESHDITPAIKIRENEGQHIEVRIQGRNMHENLESLAMRVGVISTDTEGDGTRRAPSRR